MVGLEWKMTTHGKCKSCEGILIEVELVETPVGIWTRRDPAESD